jgi:glycerol kinase
VQRNTFIIIDKVNGETYTNLISWKDRRGNEIVEKFNKSFALKAIKGISRALYWTTRREKFKQGYNMKAVNGMVS